MTKRVNKLINRFWGLIHGMWFMMILHKENTVEWTYILVLVLSFYFLAFGDSHFKEGESDD